MQKAEHALEQGMDCMILSRQQLYHVTRLQLSLSTRESICYLCHPLYLSGVCLLSLLWPGLIPASMAYAPRLLVEFMLRQRLTLWYSTPSTLILMSQYGGLLEASPAALRALLFAGEPFPIHYLRQLWQRWGARIRFLTLYGPTETNVCTYYEIRELDAQRTTPVLCGARTALHDC